MAAINGMPIRSFLDGEPGDILSMQIQAMHKIGVMPDIILWEQGQSDRATLPDLYRAQFTKLLEKFRSASPKAPVFVPVDTMSSWIPDARLQITQRGLTNFQDVYQGPNIDLIKYRYDGSHFDQKGIELQAGMWFQVLSTHFGWGQITR